MKLEILSQLVPVPNMMTGTWRRFGVHLFQGKVTLADMDHMEATGASWVRKNPGKRPRCDARDAARRGQRILRGLPREPEDRGRLLSGAPEPVRSTTSP
jgi:hypothetical protein